MHKVFWLCFIILITVSRSTVIVVNGGQVTLSGAITTTQLDFTISYGANTKWIALIWGPDQVNTDVHLFSINPNNAASPVLIKDCHLTQQSFIQYDDVDNMQPSITKFKGDISNGIKAAYNRDLSTGDLDDIRLYPNTVVQVCFMSSNQAFVGGGYEKGNEKVCGFLNLHQNTDDYSLDRLMGNYAATTLLGGANLTVYATQSTDGWGIQDYLFLSIVHKQQGLNPFTGRYLGVGYSKSLVNADIGMISYEMVNLQLKVQTRDMYAVSASSAKADGLYPVNQGSNDVVKVYGAFDSSSYLVASYKRKFSTGDKNRDQILSNLSSSTFCFYYGNSLVFTTFNQIQTACLAFNLTTSYNSNFRVVSNSSNRTVIQYQKPNNNVIVKKAYQENLRNIVCTVTILLVFFM